MQDTNHYMPMTVRDAFVLLSGDPIVGAFRDAIATLDTPLDLDVDTRKFGLCVVVPKARMAIALVRCSTPRAETARQRTGRNAKFVSDGWTILEITYGTERVIARWHRPMGNRVDGPAELKAMIAGMAEALVEKYEAMNGPHL